MLNAHGAVSYPLTVCLVQVELHLLRLRGYAYLEDRVVAHAMRAGSRAVTQRYRASP